MFFVCNSLCECHDKVENLLTSALPELEYLILERGSPSFT